MLALKTGFTGTAAQRVSQKAGSQKPITKYHLHFLLRFFNKKKCLYRLLSIFTFNVFAPFVQGGKDKLAEQAVKLGVFFIITVIIFFLLFLLHL